MNSKLIKVVLILCYILGYRKSTKDKREKAQAAKAAHQASLGGSAANTPISPNTEWLERLGIFYEY